MPKKRHIELGKDVLPHIQLNDSNCNVEGIGGDLTLEITIQSQKSPLWTKNSGKRFEAYWAV